MRFLLVFAFLLVFGNVQAQQNLVPNPSFEDTTNWNNWYVQNGSTPWFNPTSASPDYYSIYPGYGGLVPNNSNQGYQLPKTGNAFAGFYTYLGGETREYLEIELFDSLKANQTYFVEFSISRAEHYRLASDRIGAYFSDTLITQISGVAFPYIPQIENPSGNIIYDTLNWVPINGTFNANGGEKYLTIGNFRNNSNTQYDSVFTTAVTSNWAYYYIDDISVSCLSCPVSISEIQNENSIVFQNPVIANSNLKIDFSFPFMGELIVTDSEGRDVFSQIEYSATDQIHFVTPSAGIYFIHVSNKLFSKSFKLIVI